MARFFRALRRYLASLILTFSAWAILQAAFGILLEITSPVLPMIFATIFTAAFNRFVMRIPSDWRTRPPYLSEDRSYHAFLQVVAERAAEVKQQPDKQPIYLKRMYENDHARMSAVGQYLAEHQGQEWIMLSPHQRHYHPDYFRLPYTTFYVIALLPIVLPFVFSFYAPSITEANLDLTLITSALASVFYSPLFDESMLPFITWLALGSASAYIAGREIAAMRFAVPGVFGLCALAFFLCFMTSYVQSYVIDRADTPLIQLVDYLMVQSDDFAGYISQADIFRGPIEAAFGSSLIDKLEAADDYVTFARETLLNLQSRLGGFFVLPAFLLWGGLTAAAIWEINFSPAAQVTFKGRMRKPQV